MYDTFCSIPDAGKYSNVEHQQEANELTGLNSIYRGLYAFNDDTITLDGIKHREFFKNYLGRHTWNVLFSRSNIEYGAFGKDDADVIFF